MGYRVAGWGIGWLDGDIGWLDGDIGWLDGV